MNGATASDDVAPLVEMPYVLCYNQHNKANLTEAKMLIEIECVHGDKLIHGRHLDKNDIKKAMDELLKTVDERNFTSAFCSCYGYEEIPYSDTVRVDYTIDLDTHLLITPKY